MAQINEGDAEGIVTRDELLAMGCEEFQARSGGRKGYVKGGKVVALECSTCLVIHVSDGYAGKTRGFMGKAARCKKCDRRWREENREEISGYYKENREFILERGRKYRANNNEVVRERDRKYREGNSEKVRGWRREYYWENRGRLLEEARRARIDGGSQKYNRERNKLRVIRRRARETALSDDLTPEQLTEINAYFYSICALSAEPTDLHTDHVIPISIGHGGTTRGNVIPLSATLNQSKSNAHIFEWFDLNRERFNLPQRKFDGLITYLSDANDMTPQEYRSYVDWCFDNPRVIDEASGELVFINEKGTII